MNYPLWGLPAPGLLIAAVAIVHVFISHFAVGGGLFLVLAEKKARSGGDESLLGFVRSLSRFFILLTLVLGALTGVGIWFTIALVQPQATSALVTAFVWGWAIEWTFFAVEIASAMVYYYGWDRLDPRTHVRVGWIYFVSAWASLAVISGILSFMATSGGWVTTFRFADGFFNPTFWPTVALRTSLAVGLAGLYALLAASFQRDASLKARVARWSVTRWIVPASVLIPLTVLWYLRAAAQAGVAVAETLGASATGPGALLSAVLASVPAGQPVVRHAALVVVASSVLLVVGALVLAAARARRFHPIEAAVLMVLGFVSMGGSEWVREGVRKPWVIDGYMFVNGVRLPTSVGGEVVEDPFSVDALSARGVLSSARFARVPEGFTAGDGPLEERAPEARASLEAEAGRELFRLQCSACHTVDGHLGIRRLVEGRSVSALETVLDSLARPVGPEGEPTTWLDPGVRVETRLGRRMPPFVGTDAEKRALAIHLARLGGDAEAGVTAATGAAATSGEEAFETHCAACHGPDSPWPMAERLAGRSPEEFYDLLGRLPEVREEMPPFAGTEEERDALAEYLGRLAAAAPEGEVQS
jgi:mono/diheme cytochrome c family protein/cytochrome bd-type quinol oxidase subunit 1